MGDIADYYIDKMIDRHIEGPKPKRTWSDCWITKDGDAILYSQLEENHARNILKLLEKSKEVPNPRLLERIAYFDKLKKELEDLF